jgi:hypothetical protein
MPERRRLKLCAVFFFLLGTSSTLVLVALATSLILNHYRAATPGQGWSADAAEPVKVGPWGRIEALRLPLANPSGLFPDQAERLQSPKWTFPTSSENRLTRFLDSCDLGLHPRRILLDKGFWKCMSNEFEVLPPDSVVWSLSNRSKEQIYSVLAKIPANYSQRNPFLLPGAGFGRRLLKSGMTVQNMEKVMQLTYTNFGNLCFTDLHTAKEMLPPDQFEKLVGVLYEIPAYNLRLHVSSDSNIDALASYWGKGGREKRIKPLLSAVARVQGDPSVSISYLLPTFARLRLYTYPEAWNDPTVANQDCAFASMNFFNETPDTNFLDTAYTQKVLDSDYTPIDDNPTYGDLIMLFDSAGKAIHICVYIADDFVFTKNGINPAQPWVLMRIPDVIVTYYGPGKPARISILRRKDISMIHEIHSLSG